MIDHPRRPFHLYITGAAPNSGKSALAIGFMELLAARVGDVAFFRPIVASEADPSLVLMRERHGFGGPLSDYFGVLADEAHALIGMGQRDELSKRILAKFHALKARHAHIVCEAADYDSRLQGLELDFNLELANHLGCQLVPVLNGHKRSPVQIAEDVQSLRETLAEHRNPVFARIINRVDEALREAVRTRIGRANANEAPIYVLPERTILSMPTVGEVADALNAEQLTGGAESRLREVAHFKIAAMELPHFLDHLEDGSLVITPGDRADLILGSLLADASTAYPQIAGVLLTGGLKPPVQIMQLLEGLSRANVPILLAETDTFTTALAVNAVESRLASGNPRKLAAALALMEGIDIDHNALLGGSRLDAQQHTTPIRFEYELIQRARQQRKHIVLPEGREERILRAAEILLLRDVANITLLGDEADIRRRANEYGLRLDGAQIIDPTHSPLRQRYADALHAARRHKGITPQMAWDMVEDVSYFGTLMVQCGDADGMVSGAVHTTQHTIRPAFQVIRPKAGHSLISSVFLMSLADRVLVYGDCAVNPDPNAAQLAEIALTSAATALQFGIEARVAMLSYSTGESGEGESVQKVREAVAIARAQGLERGLDIKLEGPIQYDAAVDEEVARTKMPDSEVAGRATVFIFPDLNTGNNTYKAVQRTAGAVAIGPILQGLNKPVNDLSRGCTVTDIVNTVAITAIQAQVG